LRAERDRLVNLINRLQEQPDEYAKGGKVKGPSLLELREQLKQMNLQAEIPDAGVDPSKAPVPVEPSLPTLEDIQSMVPGGVAQPGQPEARLDELLGKITRRDFLEGAAGTMLPLPDPSSLVGNPFEDAPLLDPVTNVAKAAPV